MIIDGSNLAHRAYQKFENLKASNGKIEYLGKSLKILILQDIDHNMRVDKIMKFLELN